MAYTDEFVDSLASRLKGKKSFKGEDAYVKKAAKDISRLVLKDPLFYRRFGVYWWAMKAAINKYSGADVGSYFDYRMKARADHGSEFRNVLAAAYYQCVAMNGTNYHNYTGMDGAEQVYELHDPDMCD